MRGNDRLLSFGTATDLAPNAGINDRVKKVLDASGGLIGWQVYNAENDSAEYYDISGRLQTVTARNGRMQTLTYSDNTTPLPIAPYPGLLIRVTSHFGRQLNFSYDSQGRMLTMTDPGGGITTYAYDEASSIVLSGYKSAGNLTSVTYPDRKKRIYWYNDQDKTANRNFPYALTGITDENNVRYATFTYNNSGEAISTKYAGGVNKYSVNYTQPTVQTVVTDPLNSVRTYNFKTVLGVIKSSSQSQPGGSGCGPASSSVTYDTNGNIISQTDFNGKKTTYTYDLSRNLETQRIEGAGTAQARTFSTQWHTTYRLPVKVAEPKNNGQDQLTQVIVQKNLATSYTVDGLGNTTIQASPDTGSTSNTYDEAGNLKTSKDSRGLPPIPMTRSIVSPRLRMRVVLRPPLNMAVVPALFRTARAG